MGKHLNALMGRKSKSAKLKMVANLAISRITSHKNVHTVRCSQAKSDVIQLLQQGEQERALLRSQYVIEEQNMLDAFVVMEDCCHLLIERSEMIKDSRECPDDLKEAISSLIFASSRCGGFPELQELRHIFTSKFGKQLADSAVELNTNSVVHPKMIRGLSRKQASLETRQDVLKQLAKENGIHPLTVSMNHEADDSDKHEEEEQQQMMHDQINDAEKASCR